MTESFNDVILSPDVIGTKNQFFIPILLASAGSFKACTSQKGTSTLVCGGPPTDVSICSTDPKQTGRWPASLSLSIERPSINRAWSPPCCKVGSGLKFLYRMKLRAKRGLNRGVLPIFKWLKKKKLGMGIKGVV